MRKRKMAAPRKRARKRRRLSPRWRPAPRRRTWSAPSRAGGWCPCKPRRRKRRWTGRTKVGQAQSLGDWGGEVKEYEIDECRGWMSSYGWRTESPVPVLQSRSALSLVHFDIQGNTWSSTWIAAFLHSFLNGAEKSWSVTPYYSPVIRCFLFHLETCPSTEVGEKASVYSWVYWTTGKWLLNSKLDRYRSTTLHQLCFAACLLSFYTRYTVEVQTVLCSAASHLDQVSLENGGSWSLWNLFG